MMNYQLKFLGTPYFENEIISKISDKGIDVVSQVDKLKPILYLYFGQSSCDATNTSGLDLKELARELCVLPVVKDLTRFNELIPSDIRNLNGFKLKEETDVDALSNHILSYFGLININRKVFISYKRQDTEHLAMQLFDELVHRGFSPFLDSYSIEPGVDFQEYLKHELSDSEIMILLNSENFECSQYTMEEITVALQQGVGIVLVNFPNSKKRIKDLAQISEPIEMTDNPNKSKEYNDVEITSILDVVESYRARAFSKKRSTLTTEVGKVYNLDKYQVLQNGNLYSSTDNLLIELITRTPSSVDIHKMDMGTKSSYTNTERKLIFNGTNCRRDVREHLMWLNDNSQGVKVMDIVNKNIEKGENL